jgi:hypothetical protein
VIKRPTRYPRIAPRTGSRGDLLLLSLLLLAVVVPPLIATAQPPIRLFFDGDESGKLPSGWISRNGSAEQVYSIEREGAGKYLHADARETSIQLGREMKFSLREFPLLEWRWRAVLFPSHSDERKKAGDDSVLGLYVLFGHPPFLSAIKYIWSDTLPVGMTFDSPFSSRTKLVVTESGRTRAGSWVMEKRDVLADYRELFGNQEAPEATGIAVLTDGDNTNSHAVGDYGEIDILSGEAKSPAPHQ